ncbi:uncharacterized protein LAESUDRAFT_808190 [Laetiporus sulphureus 93-53]|uniref:VWFA domain-containing protein n=1 Tax=Laetiporus sulphureus 93-53 TaxID=1314785 RepID=A0A165I521_9APHY|nr:uncharacterized protein LAESUDRAFT_808190 [Laetiporus sulphureus 93-53]KZT12602.1 hypothetical protein LAESUDRAFT_808190 [Laetiporus sulphureus 93-53]
MSEVPSDAATGELERDVGNVAGMSNIDPAPQPAEIGVATTVHQDILRSDTDSTHDADDTHDADGAHDAEDTHDADGAHDADGTHDVETCDASGQGTTREDPDTDEKHQNATILGDHSGSDQNNTSGTTMSEEPLRTATDEGVLVDDKEPSELDLVSSIRGMYRILDLITEQGSGGLVDKVIIDQQSLGRLINDLQAGAYASLTKVDFAALDNLVLKPIGLYGSKHEIVRFLKDRDVVNERTADLLRLPSPAAGEPLRPHLRSGLYILREFACGQDPDIIYAIFWPQDTTWDTNAISSIRRNRVTFMRYLTKVADQILALVSDDDATKIMWKEELDDIKPDPEEEEDDRVIDFEVAQTLEQEENVMARPGFTMNLPAPQIVEASYTPWTDVVRLAPKLIPGELRQGILQVTYVPSEQYESPLSESVKTIRLKNYIERGSLRLNEGLSHEAIEVLLNHGLHQRARDACSIYQESLRTADRAAEDFVQNKVDEMQQRLNAEALPLQRAIRRFVVSSIRRNFSLFDEPSITIAEGDTEEENDRNQAVLPSQKQDHGEKQDDMEALQEKGGVNGMQDQKQDHKEGTCEGGLAPYEGKGEDLAPEDQSGERVRQCDEDEEADSMLLQHLAGLYPEIQPILDKLKDPATINYKANSFQVQKERIIILDAILGGRDDIDKSRAEELVISVMSMSNTKKTGDLLKVFDHQPRNSWIPAVIVNFFSSGGSSRQQLAEAEKRAAKISDADFLSSLATIVDHNALLTRACADIKAIAIESLNRMIVKAVKAAVHHIRSIQEKTCKAQIKREADAQKQMDFGEARSTLLNTLKDQLLVNNTSDTLFIANVEKQTNSPWRHESYRLVGSREIRTDACLRYTINPFFFTEDDRQQLQLDKFFVPTPKVHSNSSSSFELPTEHQVKHIQLLHNGKCLLIVDDSRSMIKIFLETPDTLNGALNRSACKRKLHREKIGGSCLFAFDETKRMLAILSADISEIPQRAQLHFYVFDENFVYLQSMGSPVDLRSWYDGPVLISNMAFICGNEDLVLVDHTSRARIFSFVTQQFRPAFLQLQNPPNTVLSSPDGACLMTISDTHDGLSMRAYHWSTFGSTEGISIPLPDIDPTGIVVTSFGKRSHVHLVGMKHDACLCRSIVLDITRKATEFTFQETGQSGSRAAKSQKNVIQNVFIDCHADVWTRFPVLPAIQRRTITSLAQRYPRSLCFVARDNHDNYMAYFADLVKTFERTVRKPTGNQLSETIVRAVGYEAFMKSGVQDISVFKVGEWLADLLCLIPIHLAITRDNRFIPLKDGVFSSELERSLLGADVATIVDNLSFGWYESLFQSYLASKPVKVVSSMGEQSVGKSFALNHLVDTSFAGSAMRTTEGVWMSVAPLDDMIIVALDFEGVHSIERSVQEDTLLVLFNTAISNLVLFRNNFALSRDITGLFKSFQSSSSVLDPAANPNLFQSTLVIIIKDVVDSDKTEIVKEFSLKFQHIVQLEQASNFISRLHGGRLAIIPWPVIESRQFYLLFNGLKRRLDQQRPTHTGGSIFLQTLKTLMTKLKANDWGAMSQNMAAHRAKLLLTLLPVALSSGVAELNSDVEPLKDFDTGAVIETRDTNARFFCSELGVAEPSPGRDAMLQQLIGLWDDLHTRGTIADDEWMAGLIEHLNDLVQRRIDHVNEWLNLNMAKFPSTHADIQMLRRLANNMMIDVKANVQICSLQCAKCHLLCALCRHHDGRHDCQTSHACTRSCEYEDYEAKGCGLSAGHPGRHVCDITVHLCGYPCALEDKRGCLGECTKVVNHDDAEHMCSATVHECSEPCRLVNIPLPDGGIYSCPEFCSIASHEPHLEHVCANRQCPMQCQLCARLCSKQSHLHGLYQGEVHLCGTEHPCPALCSADGICQIDTAPQSIEATFTGRHETFQYTKFIQVSKRLTCAIPIAPGRVDHNDVGPHRHTTDKDSFHSCKARCENCGYYCTLRLGHPQKEHETSHGSMSRTQWAIDGPDGTTLELDGRKFGSRDEGTPMFCSMVCRSLGRHVHVDYCRAGQREVCGGPEYEHISARMQPYPDRPKDWVTHRLFWRRTGFKDPYPNEDQNNFTLCDAMCPGPEHAASPSGVSRPSYCTLPILHPHYALDQPVSGNGLGYISNDGHAFLCRNPAVMQQAFHVIFVIDRSASMSYTDHRPRGDTPSTALITRNHNNRLGAVYSSLHAFWQARHHVTNAGGQGAIALRDAYTVLLFDRTVSECVANDFISTHDELLSAVLRYSTGRGTNFFAAIQAAKAAMEQHWNTDRSPVVIFLSDGEGKLPDMAMQDLCLRSSALGKPLSFHSVSFGRDAKSSSLRRMAQIAKDVQDRSPHDPMHPTPPSSYAEALDSVQLAETFLGIAESLRKTRGALLHSL